MTIVILIILVFLLIENTMIMLMIATLVGNKNKSQYTESEVHKINRDIEQKKFNIFADYMMNGYDKYDVNKNFVDSHSTK